MSLTDDHYDQYMMAANPNQTRVIRRNRPSLTRQPFAVHDTCQVNFVFISKQIMIRSF